MDLLRRIRNGRSDGHDYWLDSPNPSPRVHLEADTFYGNVSVDNSTAHCIALNSQSSTTKIRIDGVEAGSFAMPLTTRINQFGIKGAEVDYYTMKGAMIGAILGARGATADEQYKIEWWCSQFTGKALPADNPYRTNPPTIGGGPSLAAGGSAVALVARSANLLLGHTLPIARGTLVLTGQQVRPTAARRLIAARRAAVLTGVAAALRRSRRLVAGAAAVALQGPAVALTRKSGSRSLVVDPASFGLSWTAVGLRLSHRLASDGAAFALNNYPANLLHGYVLPAASGSFFENGPANTLRAARRLPGLTGTFGMNGQDAEIGRIGRLMLDADRGQILAFGQPLELRARRTVSAERIAFSLSGASAQLRHAARLMVGTASYSAGGQPVAVRLGRRRAVGGGLVTMTFSPATLRLSRRIVAGAGVISLVATSVTLKIGGRAPIAIPAYNCFVVPARQRLFIVPAQQRLFIVPARQRRFIIRKGTSMSISKHPAEERQYQADWSQDLNGQTIVGDIAATSSDPALIVDRVIHDGKIMTFWLRAGRAGKAATIAFVALTSGGEDLSWQQTVTCS